MRLELGCAREIRHDPRGIPLLRRHSDLLRPREGHFRRRGADYLDLPSERVSSQRLECVGDRCLRNASHSYRILWREVSLQIAGSRVENMSQRELDAPKPRAGAERELAGARILGDRPSEEVSAERARLQREDPEDLAPLRASEARRSALVDASPDAVIAIDHEGRVVELNSAAEHVFGYRREQAIGRELALLVVPERLREQALARFARERCRTPAHTVGKRIDTFAMRADGTEFPVEVALARLTPGDPPLFGVYVSDATARRHSEQEVRLERLRALTADLLLAEEEERRRLAVDLHDGLSQTIALTRIKLSALRRSKGGRLADALDEIAELIDETNRVVRSIGFELSPPILHDLGLVPAVEWLVENIEERYDIEILLEDDGQPKPADEKTRVILFRSLRELLINAAKHSGARQIRLRLELDGERLRAAVEDDGVGMEPDVEAVRGSGLYSIHERLSHVGGSMEIESAPGQGAKIRLCAPLTRGQPTKTRAQT